jgi:hypothetical protein
MSKATGETLRREILDYYHSTAKGNGGWRRVGRILGTSGGAASEIAYGHRPPTLRHISRWVQSDHSCLVVSRPCPTCLRERGEAVDHAEGLDCHGDPVERVVALGPGEVVQKQRKPRRYNRITDMPVSLLAQAVRERTSLKGPHV